MDIGILTFQDLIEHKGKKENDYLNVYLSLFDIPNRRTLYISSDEQCSTNFLRTLLRLNSFELSVC